MKGLDDWVKFYRKDYKRVGVLEGRYFDSDGQQTEYSRHVRDLIESAKGNFETIKFLQNLRAHA